MVTERSRRMRTDSCVCARREKPPNAACERGSEAKTVRLWSARVGPTTEEAVSGWKSRNKRKSGSAAIGSRVNGLDFSTCNDGGMRSGCNGALLADLGGVGGHTSRSRSTY
jgi:hypothetical protein